MQLASFVNYITYERRFSPHTVKAYVSDIAQLSSFLEETYETVDVHTATYHQLRSWIVTLVDDQAGPRSVNRKISAVKAYFKFMLRKGLVASNPAARLKAIRIPKRLPNFLQERDTDRLWQVSDHIDESYPTVRDLQILRTLYCTGMRRSELISLRLTDVDLDSKTYRVLGKGGKTRLIPFSVQHKKAILNYLEVRASSFESTESFFFLTDRGLKLYPKFVYNLVRRHLGSVSSLTQRGPHTLRHTFATHLSDRGADLNAIKSLLGHASLNATQIYTHNSIEKLKKAYQKAHPKAEK